MNKAGMRTISTELQGVQLSPVEKSMAETNTKKKKKASKPLRCLDAKYTNLLEMHEVYCNMVMLLFYVKLNSNFRKLVKACSDDTQSLETSDLRSHSWQTLMKTEP